MSETAKTSTDRSTLIDRFVTELSFLAKEHCPDASVEVTFTHYEDEDAHVFVFVPQGTSATDLNTLQEALTDRSIQILVDERLLILAGVYEATQHNRTATTNL